MTWRAKSSHPTPNSASCLCCSLVRDRYGWRGTEEAPQAALSSASMAVGLGQSPSTCTAPQPYQRKMNFTLQPCFVCLQSMQLSCSPPSGSDSPRIRDLSVGIFSLAGLQSHINIWFLCRLSDYCPFPDCIILSPQLLAAVTTKCFIAEVTI